MGLNVLGCGADILGTAEGLGTNKTVETTYRLSKRVNMSVSGYLGSTCTFNIFAQPMVAVVRISVIVFLFFFFFFFFSVSLLSRFCFWFAGWTRRRKARDHSCANPMARTLAATQYKCMDKEMGKMTFISFIQGDETLLQWPQSNVQRSAWIHGSGRRSSFSYQ